MAVVYVFMVVVQDGTAMVSMPGTTKMKFVKVVPVSSKQLKASVASNENYYYEKVFKKMGFKRLPGGTGNLFHKVVTDERFNVKLNEYWVSWKIDDGSKSYDKLVSDLKKLFLKTDPTLAYSGLQFSKTEWKY